MATHSPHTTDAGRAGECSLQGPGYSTVDEFFALMLHGQKSLNGVTFEGEYEVDYKPTHAVFAKEKVYMVTYKSHPHSGRLGNFSGLRTCAPQARYKRGRVGQPWGQQEAREATRAARRRYNVQDTCETDT